MGYSIYAIVPKNSAKDVRAALESLKKPSELFGYAPNDEIDGSFAVATNGELAYRTKSHQRKGDLIGFNYSGPNNAVRELLYSAIALVACEVGERARFGKQNLPAYYYDGQPTAIFSNREDARASGISEFDVRDDVGMRVPTGDKAVEVFFVVAPAHLQAIRDTSASLKVCLQSMGTQLAGSSGQTASSGLSTKSISRTPD